MGQYLVARLAGSRGHGTVGYTTLVGMLSKLKSWLQKETGKGAFCRTFSVMSYPKVFKTLSRIHEHDAGLLPN